MARDGYADPQDRWHLTPPGRPRLELGAGVMTDGRKAGPRGEGAEPPSMGVLAADRKTRGSGREGLAYTAGRAGGQALAGSSSHKHRGLTGRGTHRHGD